MPRCKSPPKTSLTAWDCQSTVLLGPFSLIRSYACDTSPVKSQHKELHRGNQLSAQEKVLLVLQNPETRLYIHKHHLLAPYPLPVYRYTKSLHWLYFTWEFPFAVSVRELNLLHVAELRQCKGSRNYLHLPCWRFPHSKESPPPKAFSQCATPVPALPPWHQGRRAMGAGCPANIYSSQKLNLLFEELL